jgi:hypothetical protein
MLGVRNMIRRIGDLVFPESAPIRPTDDERESERRALDRADEVLKRSDDIWQEHIREGWGLPPRDTRY